jgi:hypothetical protein
MILVTLAALVTLAVGSSGRSGPTMATEDTMRTELSEMLVKAPRVTLDEILDRVTHGEARRDSSIHDQAFTAAFRLVRNSNDPKKKPELMSEVVYRVYKKKPDYVRGVRLRQWELKPDKNDDDATMSFRSDMSEQIVNFAFRPENRRDFKYRIVGRDVVGEHLVYRIAFEPRSVLDPSIPSGLVWVDTNEFVIVRQEVSFDRSPVPLFLKGVDRMVIERQRVDSLWVLSRALLRATFTVPMPEVGRSIDMAIQFSEYAINSGLPDSLFVNEKGGRRR